MSVSMLFLNCYTVILFEFGFILGELENGGNVRLKEQASLLKTNKLGIVIPFRERFDELLEFVPHIHSFLENQNVLHEIFVINQVILHIIHCCKAIN